MFHQLYHGEVIKKSNRFAIDKTSPTVKKNDIIHPYESPKSARIGALRITHIYKTKQM